MFGEVTKKGECVVLGGGEEMWFADGSLSSAQAAEKPLVGGEARVEMRSVFCELPSLCFEFEMLRDKGPVERRHPIGNEIVFMDPGLIIGVVGGELNGGEVVYVVMRVPEA